MKVLLRNDNGKPYVWRDATWHNGVYKVKDDLGRYNVVYQRKIIAVDEDNRSGCVVCRNCGEMISNTPEEIEAHFAEKEVGRDCLKCSHLEVSRVLSEKKSSYTKNEDGTYAVSETYNAKLGCYRYWSSYPLGSPQAEQQCEFRLCRVQGVKEIDDIFVKYPNVFSKFLTVDILLNNNYAYEGYRNGYFCYDLQCRGALKACVNADGVVDCYLCSSRGEEYYMHYSSEHHKIFFEWGDRYREDVDAFVSAGKRDMMLKRLKKLYEEAEA